MASRLKCRPVVAGKSGSSGAPGCSRSQAFKTATVLDMSGVRRSFLPLPTQAHRCASKVCSRAATGGCALSVSAEPPARAR